MTTAQKIPDLASDSDAVVIGSDVLFGVGQLDLFGQLGQNVSFRAKWECKVSTFESSESWGEYEDGKIRIHSELTRRHALVILFHEAAHAIWERETMGKKEDEETVCEKIAEGLARMVLGNKLEPWIAAAKAESWEVPSRKSGPPSEVLALDCEGIEKAVAANKCVRNAPMHMRPFDMFSHGGAYGKYTNEQWKPRNRYLVRQGVKAVRKARERLRESLANEPAHLWAVHFGMVETAEYSLRVRCFWRNGDRPDFSSPNSRISLVQNRRV